jgi:hypothetical protein
MNEKQGFTRHTGVLFSIIILLVLIVWNWDKCYHNTSAIYDRITTWLMGATSQKYTTDVNTTAAAVTREPFTVLSDGIDESKLTVKINPDDKSVAVSFDKYSGSDAASANIKGYLLVLAKYDTNLQQVGALNVKVSDEGGASFKDALSELLGKYSSSVDQTTINNLKKTVTDSKPSIGTDTSTASYVATQLTATDIIKYNQLTDLFFAVLELLYTYRRKVTTGPSGTLKTVYGELNDVLKTIKGASSVPLPTESTTVSDVDKGITGIKFETVATGAKYTDTMAKSDAEQLQRAITDYPALRDALAGISTTPGTSDYFETKLKDFMQKLVDIYMTSVNTRSESSICDSAGKCGYTFTELEELDPNGNPYNYKLGVGIITTGADGTDKVSKVEPFTYGGGGGRRMTFFKLTNTLEEQTKLLRRLEMVDRNKLASATVTVPTQVVPGQVSGQAAGGDIDAYMRMLRPYLGDFPNEFQITQKQANDISLSKYLNESLALGQLNLNVAISDRLEPTVSTASGQVNFD